MSFLSGYKTYIAGVGTILVGIALCIDGKYEEGVQSILLGLGMCGIKAAVKKGAGE